MQEGTPISTSVTSVAVHAQDKQEMYGSMGREKGCQDYNRNYEAEEGQERRQEGNYRCYRNMDRNMAWCAAILKGAGKGGGCHRRGSASPGGI